MTIIHETRRKLLADRHSDVLGVSSGRSPRAKQGAAGGGATGLVAGREAGAVLVVAVRALAAHMTQTLRCSAQRVDHNIY
jgi:hypothetical protein